LGLLQIFLEDVQQAKNKHKTCGVFILTLDSPIYGLLFTKDMGTAGHHPAEIILQQKLQHLSNFQPLSANNTIIKFQKKMVNLRSM